MIVENVLKISLNHKRGNVLHEKDDGIACSVLVLTLLSRKKGQKSASKTTTKAFSSAKEERSLKFVVASVEGRPHQFDGTG